MKNSILALSLIIATIILSSCGNSRKTIAIEEGWDLLGESTVNFIRDKDEVKVTSSNRYTAIRFRVEDKNIRLKDLKIVFSSGDRLEPLLDDVIPAGENSRIIELSQEGKNISHIEFKYRSTGSLLSGRAKVLVFGRRYPY